jgi:hypothetical protein
MLTCLCSEEATAGIFPTLCYPFMSTGPPSSFKAILSLYLAVRVQVIHVNEN